MRKLIGCLVLLNLALACGDGFEKQKSKHPGRTQESQEVDTFGINQDYLQLVNDHRIKRGLVPLTYNPIVEEIAKSHSKGMALRSRPFGHLGISLRCRRLKNRLGRIRECSEIVAMGQKNIKDLFQAWIKSLKHRELIEGQTLTHTGLGIYKDDRGVTYWTQMLIQL